MTKQKFGKCLYLLGLFIIIISLLSACQEKEESFRVLIFSNIPQESIIKGENLLESYAVEDTKMKVDLYPAMLERLVIDIVDHSGDIIILEKEMLPAIKDPIGLYPLDELMELEDFPDSVEFQATDEKGKSNFYAVPIPTDQKLFQNITLPSELVAIIPRYTEYREEAFTILKALINKD